MKKFLANLILFPIVAIVVICACLLLLVMSPALIVIWAYKEVSE